MLDRLKEIERERDAVPRVDADGGLGVHVQRAMAIAIERAVEADIGAEPVHNVGHIGGAEYHASERSRTTG